MKASDQDEGIAPSSVRVGRSYPALRGGWIYEVERGSTGAVIFYTVLQTGQRCATTRYDFARRVGPALAE